MDKTLLLQVLLIAAGVLAVAAGIYRDEVRTVLMKAIYICLECIGIG
ncbi:MAG: thioredoxin [Clostridiales bacterium]|nr:thioredoxin [Clostridiales bacterium]